MVQCTRTIQTLLQLYEPTKKGDVVICLFLLLFKKMFLYKYAITEIDREEIHNNFRLVVFSKLLIFFFFLNENSLSLYMDESQTFLKVILTINYKSTIKLLIKDLSNSKCDNDNKKSVISITVSKNCWQVLTIFTFNRYIKQSLPTNTYRQL